MLSFIIRKLRKEDGQAVVELALTLPILIMILCAIIDFGWYFTNQNIIDNCSRQGARYAIVHSTDSIPDLEDYTESIAPVSIGSPVVATVTKPTPSNPFFLVGVTKAWKPLTPIVDVFVNVLGEPITELSSACKMRVEP